MCVQVALHNSPQVACASTYLASNIFEKRPDLGKSLIAGRSSEDDWRLLLKRDPAHASPGKLWELHTLRTHYHPSCRAWAEKLASSKTIQYGGDPLVDFGLMRFLDRFAYRNPKQRTKQHGHARTTAIDDRVPVKALTGKHLDSVAPEDRFFLRSFKAVASKKEDVSSSDDDDDDVRADAMDFAADDLDLEDDSDSDDSPIVGLPIYDSDLNGLRRARRLRRCASDASSGDSGDSGSAGSEPDDFPFSEDDEDDAAPSKTPRRPLLQKKEAQGRVALRRRRRLFRGASRSVGRGRRRRGGSEAAARRSGSRWRRNTTRDTHSHGRRGFRRGAREGLGREAPREVQHVARCRGPSELPPRSASCRAAVTGAIPA